jgi:hypothetical protein
MWILGALLVGLGIFLLAINTVGVIVFVLGVGAVLETGNWLFGIVCIAGLWLMAISE